MCHYVNPPILIKMEDKYYLNIILRYYYEYMPSFFLVFLLFETVLSKRIEITVISYLRKNKRKKHWNTFLCWRTRSFGIFIKYRSALDWEKSSHLIISISTDLSCLTKGKEHHFSLLILNAKKLNAVSLKPKFNLSNSVLNFHWESCCTQKSGKTAIVQKLRLWVLIH